MSTRIPPQFCTRTTFVGDWRVVNIPNEDSRAMDVPKILDSLEPFVPTPADYDASIRAAIGGSQQGDFQDLPLTVCVADVVHFFTHMMTGSGCGFNKK